MKSSLYCSGYSLHVPPKTIISNLSNACPISFNVLSLAFICLIGSKSLSFALKTAGSENK